MLDQYYGIQQLYQVVLKAKTPMQFGSRKIEADEPVLYFQNVKISLLSQRTNPIMARGGWANLPQVIWEDRSDVTFTLSEGILSSIGMGVLFSANVVQKKGQEELLVRRREGPFYLEEGQEGIQLQDYPYLKNGKKAFIYKYQRDMIQQKMYGILDTSKSYPFIRIFEDRALTKQAPCDTEYVIEYYYKYPRSALIYRIQKQRFNGLFTLEGKFYSKDENEGINYTNLIYMPKVRVVSDINLRLGEKADPTMSVFNIIGMPDNQGTGKDGLILQITRLDSDIDGDI